MPNPLLREIDQYRREVGHHWINLAAGGLMVVVGFVANATGFVIPPWIWWALALVFLTLAQFRAYRDVRRRLGDIEANQAGENERRKRLINQRDLSGETCFVWELFEPPPVRPLTENRTFTDCILVGPAVIVFPVGSRIENCSLAIYGIDSFEECLFEEPIGSVKQGTFGFVNCTFVRCKFRGIAYRGDKAFLDRLRSSPGLEQRA